MPLDGPPGADAHAGLSVSLSDARNHALRNARKLYADESRTPIMTDPMSDAPVDNMDPMETQETATVQPPIEDGDDLQQAQRELESQKDKYLRLAAEYDNFRRRAVKERQEAGWRAQGELVRGLAIRLKLRRQTNGGGAQGEIDLGDEARFWPCDEALARWRGIAHRGQAQVIYE